MHLLGHLLGWHPQRQNYNGVFPLLLVSARLLIPTFSVVLYPFLLF
jgi:hypothetical protein